jgi:YihY family inner membrane protein
MKRLGSYVSLFWRKAYMDNLTGLAGMVAYNLLLSLLPLALLALFIAGRALESADLQQSVLADLHRLFPDAAGQTLTDLLNRVRTSSTTAGIAALLASIWIGASFWGALDTAFCRIYHVRCRGWWEQKRFALAMLLVVIAFMAATVAVPALQAIVAAGAANLPFGLADVHGVVFAISLGLGLIVLFGVLCVVYWAVPNRLVPWRAIWPGAFGATIAMTVVDFAFPLYLGNVSTLASFGTTFAFVLIVLVWFYALAVVLLGGAVINALRFEFHDTGELAVNARGA